MNTSNGDYGQKVKSFEWLQL